MATDSHRPTDESEEKYFVGWNWDSDWEQKKTTPIYEAR